MNIIPKKATGKPGWPDPSRRGRKIRREGQKRTAVFSGWDFDLLHCFVREQTHRPLFAAHKPLFPQNSELSTSRRTKLCNKSNAAIRRTKLCNKSNGTTHRMPHVRGCPESSHRQRAGAGSGAACGSPLALEASRAFRRSYCGKLGGSGFAAIREADASRPRRTLTLQERAERSESAAAAEAERARAAELERDRAQEAGREARGKLSEMEAALWDVTRQRNDARAALESAGIGVQAAEEAARKQRTAKAQAEEEAHRRAVAAADARAERQRRLDARRSHWTRERQAREKYAGRMAEWEAGRWTSEASMVDSLKRAFKQENDLQQSLERGGTDSQARRYWARGRRHAGRAGRIRGQARR